MFYYIIFCILGLVSLLEVVTVPRQTKKIIYISISTFFIILGSLRWNTGNDWRPYYTFFTKFTVDDPYFLIAMEPGFAQFVKILRIFSSNFTFYLTVLSIITIGIKTSFFFEYSGAVFLALILYWGTNLSDIIAVRQTLAISLCLLSSHFIIKRQPWYFLIFVLVSAQIHVTSYIFLPSYYIYHAEWSVRNKCFLLIIAVAIGSLSVSENILEIISTLTPSGIGLDRINDKALTYLEEGNEFGARSQLNKTQRLIAALSKRAVLLPIFLFFQEKVQIFRERYKGFLNLYTYGNIIFFLVLDFLTLQRAASYFYIFEILLLCIIFVNVHSKSIWLLIIILYAFLKLFSLVYNLTDQLVPYIWIFSEDTYRFVY